MIERVPEHFHNGVRAYLHYDDGYWCHQSRIYGELPSGTVWWHESRWQGFGISHDAAHHLLSDLSLSLKMVWPRCHYGTRPVAGASPLRVECEVGVAYIVDDDAIMLLDSLHPAGVMAYLEGAPYE